MISTWVDREQGITASASGTPQLLESRLNGQPVLTFDSGDFFRVAVEDNPLDDAESFAVAVVFATSSDNLFGTDGNWFFNSGIVDANAFGLAKDWGISISREGRLAAGVGTPATTVYSSANRLNDGQAHVAILTQSDGEIALYADGEKSHQSGANADPRDARVIKFGSGGSPFDGWISDIQLFRGRMDADQAGELSTTLLNRFLNLPPTAVADHYTTPEDTTLVVSTDNNLLQNDTDPEGDSFQAEIVSETSHGVVKLNPDGTFTYRPDQDFFGTDSFSYVAIDDQPSNRVTVTIEVSGTPDPLMAIEDTYITSVDVPISITPTAGVLSNDLNADLLSITATLTKSPQGELSLADDGSFQYSPPPGMVGVDIFSYLITNERGDTYSEDVVIQVQSAAITISEISASNWNNLEDEDRESSDWVELFNFGTDPLDLTGWYLTDQLSDLSRWQFPAGTILAPNEFLVVFASGKDRREGELHTNFRLSSSGESVTIVLPDGKTLATNTALSFPPQQRNTTYGLPFVEGAIRYPLQAAPLASATPGAPNSGKRQDLGPVILETSHSPAEPTPSDDFLIQTVIAKSDKAPRQVQAHLRLMYGDSLSVDMHDDGLNGDLEASDGVYSVLIPSQQLQDLWAQDGNIRPIHGGMLRYYITAQNSDDNESRSPYLVDPDNEPDQAEYFGTIFHGEAETSLPVLHWFVPDPEWHQTLGNNNLRWSRASVYFDGSFYDNLKVRVRGITTQSWSKPKFKFEFNPGDRFRLSDELPDVDEFNLQSHFMEKGATSYMGENLAFGFLQQIGVPAPHTQHLHVRQNGEFYSLGSYIEQIDATFLERNGFDPYGSMYKANSPSALSTLAPNPTRNHYQKVTRKFESFEDLREFTDGINNRQAGVDRSTYLFDRVDLPQVINNMAGNTILTNHDRLTKNYYVYQEPSSGEWHRFPWDMDQAFAKRTDRNFSSIFYGNTEHPQATGRPIYQNHLLDAILDTPATREMYLRRLRTLLDDYLARDYFESQIAAYDELIRADAERDHQKWESGSPAAGIARLFDHISFRRRQLLRDASVPTSNQAFTETVWIHDDSPVRVLIPSAEDESLEWTLASTEVDARWLYGQGGVGYDRALDYDRFIGPLFEDASQTTAVDLLRELDPDEDGHTTATTVYTRYEFQLDNIDDVDQLQLKMRYDDGFVAFLNGVEVARDNFIGDLNWQSVSRRGNQEAGDEREVYDLTDSLRRGEIPIFQGKNVLAIAVINGQSNSPDLLIQPQLVKRTETAPTFQLALSHHIDPEDPQLAYFEISNQEARAVDLSDWQLAGSTQFRFAAGTVIPAGHSLLVAAAPAQLREMQHAAGMRGLFIQGPFQRGVVDDSTRLIDNWNQTVDSVIHDGTNISLRDSLRITEIHYNPRGPDDLTEFIEVTHVGAQGEINLAGFRLDDGLREPFVFGDQRISQGESIVIVKDLSEFQQAYPDVVPGSIAGQYSGSLSNGGERIQLADANGNLILEVDFDDQDPWPRAADGRGSSLELINPSTDSQQGENWRASQKKGGTPGIYSSVNGDFDGSNLVDANDIDSLCNQIDMGKYDAWFDVNHDGQLNMDDHTRLVRELLGTDAGDANLDQTFDSSDLVIAFQAGAYNQPAATRTSWAAGDWTCDGVFDSSDLVAAFQTGRYQDALAALSPEALAAGVIPFSERHQAFHRVGDSLPHRLNFKSNAWTTLQKSPALARDSFFEQWGQKRTVFNEWEPTFTSSSRTNSDTSDDALTSRLP